MPNANEIYRYAASGDLHWNETTCWIADGGKNVCTGGMWLMKKEMILLRAKLSDDIDMDGVDMRFTFKQCSFLSSLVKLPDSEREKYFFLPVLGSYEYGLDFAGDYPELEGWRSSGSYWLSSDPDLQNYAPWAYAYYLCIARGSLLMCRNGCYSGFSGGSHLFK